MTQQTKSLLQLANEIDIFFKMNDIDASSVIRLKNKEAELRLISIIQKESELTVKLGLDIGYIDIYNIRFVWPMK